jgi:hypothetical protein
MTSPEKEILTENTEREATKPHIRKRSVTRLAKLSWKRMTSLIHSRKIVDYRRATSKENQREDSEEFKRFRPDFDIDFVLEYGKNVFVSLVSNCIYGFSILLSLQIAPTLWTADPKTDGNCLLVDQDKCLVGTQDGRCKSAQTMHLGCTQLILIWPYMQWSFLELMEAQKSNGNSQTRLARYSEMAITCMPGVIRSTLLIAGRGHSMVSNYPNIYYTCIYYPLDASIQ